MPVSKKRKNARKTAKQYRMVRFTSDLFEDDFVFPDMDHLSIGLIEALNKGDFGIVCQWLDDAGVDKDSIEAFRDLEQAEVEEFSKAWGNGSLVDLPKSSD